MFRHIQTSLRKTDEKHQLLLLKAKSFHFNFQIVPVLGGPTEVEGRKSILFTKGTPEVESKEHLFASFWVIEWNGSSKEMGFFNPRSQLDSTIVTYCPMQLKNGEDR